jgi:flagellar basal-body rod protein FlgG
LTGEGEVVTSEGYRVAAGITVPTDARRIEINREGGVFAIFDGQVGGQQLGDIQLATFINDKGLEAIGENLFLETAASGPPNVGEPGIDGRGAFRQGYLEESSVDVVVEITELIEAQRGYELNSRVLSAADEMLSTTSRIR